MSVTYLLKRIGLFFLVVWLGVTINFFLPRLAPGDPIQEYLGQLAQAGMFVGDPSAGFVEEYRAKFGLDKPMWQQYVNYWRDVAQFKFGLSVVDYPVEVTRVVRVALPWTLGLMGLATTVSFIIGSVAGALIASPFGKIGHMARWGTPAALTMYATPYFIFGMILIWLFVWLVEIFPTGGGYTLGETPQFTWHGIRTLLWHGTLPTLSIILTGTAHWLVLMRGMMVTVEGEDYVIQSRAMGLQDWRIFAWYRMRNCALPQFTQLFLSMGIIFTGAVMVEIVFAYPGIGYLLQQAILGNDSNTVQSIVITTALMFAVLLAVMETIYPLIDRRIALP